MKKLSKSFKDGQFAVVAELVSGRQYNPAPIKKFLADAKEAGKEAIPAEFNFAAITLPQNPGGAANLGPGDVLAQLEGTGLLDDLGFMPHLSCKDHNLDALQTALIGFRQRGVESVLVLTGDKPLTAKGVFEADSLVLLQTIARMNRELLLKAHPDKLAEVPQLFPGAAVSPFKYTEPSLMQQYYKMEKKAAAGARFMITQVGWDWKKSVELMTYLREVKLDIPIIGNVYLLTSTNPAPRLMNTGKLPGCYVSDELLKQLRAEGVDDHIERAAQQVAMYKAIGAAGVDVGGVDDFATFKRILDRAAEIGERWTEHKNNLCWPAEDAFYLYDENGKRNNPPAAKQTVHQRRFNMAHRMILDPEHKGFHMLRKTMQKVGAERKPEGLAARSFLAAERTMKRTMFDCEECGDCYLTENFSYCTIGGCAKKLPNVPCGDANVDGTCGNENDGTVCRGEQIYIAAKAEGGLDRLRQTINTQRDPGLVHTSSILNYLFGKDHTRGNALISIGEAVHASIPKTGKVMKRLHDRGDDAYTADSPELAYIRALIEDQAVEGADYIAINVDAFGEKNPELAVEMMVEYVRLVKKYGAGVLACMDSSDDKVLIAGLKEWYSGDEPVGQPLINSIKTYTADEMMPLKKDYDFAFIGMLMSENAPTGPGGSHSVEELVGLARELFEMAVQHGFKPEEIFFDSTVFPLAIDMPMMPGVPGYTYRAFETIKAIKEDPKMQDVHFSLGVSNCCRDLPGRRIGICRAYVAKAMEYGLDAGIVNVSHHYGAKPVDPKLYEMVSAYAEMDGDQEKADRVIELMNEFCAAASK